MASKVDPEKTTKVGAESEETRTCEIEEVALVVPETDDPSAGDDIPDLVPRHHLMHHPHIPQHLLQLPHSASHHFRHSHANRCLARRKVHG